MLRRANLGASPWLLPGRSQGYVRRRTGRRLRSCRRRQPGNPRAGPPNFARAV